MPEKYKPVQYHAGTVADFLIHHGFATKRTLASFFASWLVDVNGLPVREPQHILDFGDLVIVHQADGPHAFMTGATP
jgi:hypothetical protein